MIGFLRGKIIEKSPTALIIDCLGIGFYVQCPLSTSAKIGSPGDEVALYIYPFSQERGVELYGFATAAEKDIFSLLISCPGVGPKASLSLLSRMDCEEIKLAIKEKRVSLLKRVPGIGPKKAEMIIFKLADKYKEVKREEEIPEEAVAGLISLGLSRKEALSKIRAIPDFQKLSVAEMIKEALKR